MQPNFRFMRSLIYKLKRQFAQPIDIYRLVATTNVSTGKITKAWTKYSVPKAILLPEDEARKFVYELSFRAANRDFAYGGMFDESMRRFLISARDIPKNLDINENDFVVFNHKRYQIKGVRPYEQGEAIMLTVTWLRGTVAYEEHDILVNDDLFFNDGAVRS